MSGHDAATVGRRSGITFDNVKQPKLAEVVAEQVREDIGSGALEVGTRLPPERDLIEQFGVSRGTMREALTLLESQGFVDVRTGRNGGAYVTMPDVHNLVSSFDVVLNVHNTPLSQILVAREYIEPIATSLACTEATEEDLVRLAESVDNMAAALEEQDEHRYRTETVGFHVLIAEATHNQLIHTFTVITQELVFSKAYPHLSEVAGENVKAHRRILEALQARDVDAATRRMRRHVDAFADVVKPV